jgi:hypothetical protein
LHHQIEWQKSQQIVLGSNNPIISKDMNIFIKEFANFLFAHVLPIDMECSDVYIGVGNERCHGLSAVVVDVLWDLKLIFLVILELILALTTCYRTLARW